MWAGFLTTTSFLEVAVLATWLPCDGYQTWWFLSCNTPVLLLISRCCSGRRQEYSRSFWNLLLGFAEFGTVSFCGNRHCSAVVAPLLVLLICVP